LLEPPPQRTCTKINPQSRAQSSILTNLRFLKPINPVATNATPGSGSHITYDRGHFGRLKARLKFGLEAAVVMVRAEVPDPFATVTEVGLNWHAALGGSPEQERVTDPLKSPCDCTVTVDEAGCPALTATVPGETATVKSPALLTPLTSRMTALECASDPEVAAIAIVLGPAGVVAEVLTVRVEVAGPLPGVREAGLKEHVAPTGNPEQESDIGLSKLLVGTAVIV
jgi:hypothetical protein